MKHGSYSTYCNHSCRCPRCIQAAKEYRRLNYPKYRNRDYRKGSHGTRTRYVYGCRCDKCAEANRFYQSKWEKSGRRVESERPILGHGHPTVKNMGCKCSRCKQGRIQLTPRFDSRLVRGAA